MKKFSCLIVCITDIVHLFTTYDRRLYFFSLHETFAVAFHETVFTFHSSISTNWYQSQTVKTNKETREAFC